MGAWGVGMTGVGARGGQGLMERTATKTAMKPATMVAHMRPKPVKRMMRRLSKLRSKVVHSGLKAFETDKDLLDDAFEVAESLVVGGGRCLGCHGGSLAEGGVGGGGGPSP